MIIKNANAEQICQALEVINETYNKNICFNNFKREGQRYRITLRVRNSRLAGARRSGTGRRTVSACWHVHGDFFDQLLKINPNAIINLSSGLKINKDHGNWIDIELGSIYNRVYMSDLCDC